MTTGAVLDFDLHKLGWRAFEDLVGVIAREILGQTVQVFADGRDGGRDGAFEGEWVASEAAEWSHLSGKLVIQCKFSKDSHKNLTVASLQDEFEKLKGLVSAGRCTSYILLTNYSISAENALKLEDEAKRAGATAALALGKDWINQTISLSDRLRRFVPRVYGLGDVSLIFDDRARTQSETLLADLRPRLERFVLTSTYERAARALAERRIIVLLGEPAVGKTLMAATLALAALDEFHSTPYKVNSASELKEHWNPNEPRTFWIDDAFGATRLEEEKVHDWESNFHAVMAAVAGDNRVILTSRSHLYRQAVDLLKDGTRTELGNRTIQISVEDLSDRERSQMLYNHVRYGDQPKRFKSALKPHLQTLAGMRELKPEIARRLGSAAFTRDIELTSEGLRRFVAHPTGFLVGVLRELDDSSKSAIAAIFVSRGRLLSPIDEIREAGFRFILERFDVKRSAIAVALEAMKNTLVRFVTDEEDPYWTYFHPTIGEAFEQLVQSDPELLGVFVRGVNAETIVATFDCTSGGSRVRRFWKQDYVKVPLSLHNVVVDRLNLPEARSPGGIFGRYAFGFRFRYLPFLDERITDQMLTEISQRDSSLITDLADLLITDNFSRCIPILRRVGNLRSFSKEERLAVGEAVRYRAFNYADPEWAFGGELLNLLDPEEAQDVQSEVRSQLDDVLSSIASVTYDRWHPSSNPEDTFTEVLVNLEDLSGFEGLTGADREQIRTAIAEVEEKLAAAEDDYEPEPDEDDYEGRISSREEDFLAEVPERDIFDDVDAD